MLVIFTLWYVLLLLLLISFCFFVLMMNDIAMYMAILIHFSLNRSASNFCITHGNADSFLFEPFSFQFLYYHY